MFKKSKTGNYYLYSTEVENFFISDFMTKAPGEYVKAYLLALMFAQLGASVDNESIKRQLAMSDDEIEDCWAYWESLGIIKRSNASDSSYDVELVNLRELIGTPKLCEEHIESALDEKALSQLYKEIQKATGRMIELREMQEIVSWINDYNLSPELIVFCYKYCASKRKSSAFRYVGAVLRDWKDKGIKTADEAEDFLGENDSRFGIYRAIFSELGFSRNPTAEEKRIMNEWIDKYNYTQRDVLQACKQTAAISNPNIKYVDAVLRNTKGKDPEKENKESVAIRINRLYEEIRKENEEKTKANRAAVFRKIPSIEAILREQSELSIKQTQAMLRRDSASLKAAKERAEELARKRKELLLQAGFEANALDSIYSCAKCKDTGVTEDGSPCSCYGEKLEKINVEE